jgi:hypothetical protein
VSPCNKSLVNASKQCHLKNIGNTEDIMAYDIFNNLMTG